MEVSGLPTRLNARPSHRRLRGRGGLDPELKTPQTIVDVSAGHGYVLTRAPTTTTTTSATTTTTTTAAAAAAAAITSTTTTYLEEAGLEASPWCLEVEFN